MHSLAETVQLRTVPGHLPRSPPLEQVLRALHRLEELLSAREERFVLGDSPINRGDTSLNLLQMGREIARIAQLRNGARPNPVPMRLGAPDDVHQTSISTVHHGRHKPFTRITADLNRGAHGKYVFVCYSMQAPVECAPITDVNAKFCGERPPPLPTGWEYATWQETSTPADANKGAKGIYIFISFKRG
jgi:hypothetical protein